MRKETLLFGHAEEDIEDAGVSRDAARIIYGAHPAGREGRESGYSEYGREESSKPRRMPHSSASRYHRNITQVLRNTTLRSVCQAPKFLAGLHDQQS